MEEVLKRKHLLQILKELKHGFISDVDESELFDIINSTYTDCKKRLDGGEEMYGKINVLEVFHKDMDFYKGSEITDSLIPKLQNRVADIIDELKTNYA